jgi:hypothetical protein
MNASVHSLSQSVCSEHSLCAAVEREKSSASPRAMSLSFDSRVEAEKAINEPKQLDSSPNFSMEQLNFTPEQMEQLNNSACSFSSTSSSTLGSDVLDTVAQRLKKLNLFPKEDLSLPTIDSFKQIEIPTLDFDDVHSVVKGTEEKATFHLKLPKYPLGAKAEEKTEATFKHREGKLFLQAQSLQLIQTASNAKRLEGGTIALLAALGGSVYECTTNAIELGDRIVAFPSANLVTATANNKNNTINGLGSTLDTGAPTILSGSQLNIQQQHQSCAMEVSGDEKDTLVISLLFQSQNSSNGSSLSLAKSLRGKMQQFISKRKASVSASTLRSVSSTLSFRTSSNASMLFGGEVLVAHSEIQLNEARYSEIFGGKLIEMEVRFEGNSWVQSVKLCCCFVPLQDSLGPVRNTPDSLNEAVQTSELRSIAALVLQQGIVQCKSKSQPWWKRQVALLRGSMLVLYAVHGKGLQVERILDLGNAFAVSGFNSERTSMMPRSFRIWIRAPSADDWIDFVATSKAEYNSWVGNLKRVMRVFANAK